MFIVTDRNCGGLGSFVSNAWDQGHESVNAQMVLSEMKCILSMILSLEAFETAWSMVLRMSKIISSTLK